MQCHAGLAWRVYVKPRPKSNESLNAKDCVEMAIDQKYIGILSDVEYK